MHHSSTLEDFSLRIDSSVGELQLQERHACIVAIYSMSRNYGTSTYAVQVCSSAGKDGVSLAVVKQSMRFSRVTKLHCTYTRTALEQVA